MRLVLIVGMTALAALIGFGVLSGPPTNRTVTIEGAAEVRQVCATVQSVSGQRPVDLGGGFVAAPLWLEAHEPTTAELWAGSAIEVATSFDVTFVRDDGSVISQHRSGPSMIAATEAWTGALVESRDVEDADRHRAITAVEGC